ncbi:hypothetical protein BRC62_04285 [Halobacteriales archaeon QH_10_67_13]|nr:MAG: hypothetical protein BRC62_04285 [Halobacteriales archaeon QH_10_67_13]
MCSHARLRSVPGAVSETTDREYDREAEPGVDDSAGPFEIDRSRLVGFAGLVALWLVTILGGMALADEVAATGAVLFEDPDEVGNVGIFGVYVLVATGVMLLGFRYARLVHLRVVGAAVFGLFAGTFVAIATGVGSVAGGGALTGLPTSPVPIAVGLVVAAVLFVYPEWYVVDLVAVALGAVTIPMLGLGFGPLPIVVLLVVWAAYDAYSVYVSGHMKELATGAGDLKLPILYVVPHSLSYSLVGDGLELGLDEDDPNESGDSAAERSADSPPNRSAEDSEASAKAGPSVQLLGLGDAIIPGMLAVSAGTFLDAPAVVPALNANLPALGAIAGGFLGMGALLVLLHRVEGAHAGLPPLNAGVLLGYLAGAVAAGVPVATALGL